MTKSALYGSTDYPIVELGDKPGQRAPRRNVKVTGYDRNKYVDITVFGGKGVTVETSIKRGYLCPFNWKKRTGKYGRYFSHRELCNLPPRVF